MNGMVRIDYYSGCRRTSCTIFRGDLADAAEVLQHAPMLRLDDGQAVLQFLMLLLQRGKIRLQLAILVLHGDQDAHQFLAQLVDLRARVIV